MRKAADDYGLYAFNTKWDNTFAIAEEKEDAPFFDWNQLTAINLSNNITLTRQEVKNHSPEMHNRKRLSQRTNTEAQWEAIKQLAPSNNDMVITTPNLDSHALRATVKLHNPKIWKENQIDPESIKNAEISKEIVEIIINAIQSKETTPEEQALGFFTRKKLKTLSTLDL